MDAWDTSIYIHWIEAFDIVLFDVKFDSCIVYMVAIYSIKRCKQLIGLTSVGIFLIGSLAHD